MRRNRAQRVAGVRRRTRIAAAALAVTLAAGIAALPTQARPTGEYAPYYDCPLLTVEGCVLGTTTGGKFTVGNKTVPIKHAITLQGGFYEFKGATHFVGAADGNTLSKTPQTVPGGLTGVPGLSGEVTATTELAAPASAIELNQGSLLGEAGTALLLPVKVRLGNPYLGSKCYLGSNAHPIMLALITTTTSPPPPNKPITGRVGTLLFNGPGTILTVTNNALVNNSFSAPGVEGCGSYPPVIDQLVNRSIGVPAAAGHNTAILEGALSQAGAEAILESEI